MTSHHFSTQSHRRLIVPEIAAAYPIDSPPDHLFHFCGSGRAAVLAPELTREAVYDALEWEDPAYDSDQPAAYHVRVVQIDRESAWSSPVWVG